FRRPWVGEQAVVETVGDQTSGIAQHHVAGAGRERGAAEPLVRRRRPLVASGGDCGVMDNGIDRVISRKCAVEFNSSAKRLDGFVAGVGEGSGRSEGDPRSAIGKGKVGRVLELERRGKVETRARVHDEFAVEVRFSEGWCNVDSNAALTGG